MIAIDKSPDDIVNKHFDDVRDRIEKSINYVLKNGCKINGTPYIPNTRDITFLNNLLLSDNLKKLITSKPEKLEIIRRYILGQYPNIHNTGDILNRLLYKIFIRDAYNNELDKHKFISNLNINTCPYCNRNYTYSLSKSARIKPEIDHFYPKSIYPYFGISFYNLIPSCQTCNGLGVKGENDPFTKQMISPYLIKDDDYKFTFGLKKLDYLSPLNGKSSIEVKFLKKVDGNVKVFKLYDLYQLHSDHVLELIVKSKVKLSDKYRKYLKDYEGITFTDAEIDRILIGNYTSLNELHKRPFSKLYRDIALELELII